MGDSKILNYDSEKKFESLIIPGKDFRKKKVALKFKGYISAVKGKA